MITPEELARDLRARKVKRMEAEEGASPFKADFLQFDALPTEDQYEYEAVALDALQLLGIEADYSDIEARIVEHMTTVPDLGPCEKGTWIHKRLAEDLPALKQTGEEAPALKQTGEEAPALKQLAEDLPTRVERMPTPTDTGLKRQLSQLQRDPGKFNPVLSVASHFAHVHAVAEAISRPGPDRRPRRWLGSPSFMAGADIRCGDLLGIDERGMVIPYKGKDEDDECGDQTIPGDQV